MKQGISGFYLENFIYVYDSQFFFMDMVALYSKFLLLTNLQTDEDHSC